MDGTYQSGAILKTCALPREGDHYRFFRVLHPTPDGKGVIAVRIGARTTARDQFKDIVTTTRQPDPDRVLSRPMFLKFGYSGPPVIWDNDRRHYLPLERVPRTFTYQYSLQAPSSPAGRPRE